MCQNGNLGQRLLLSKIPGSQAIFLVVWINWIKHQRVKIPLTLLHNYLRHSSQKDLLAGHRPDTWAKAPNLHSADSWPSTSLQQSKTHWYLQYMELTLKDVTILNIIQYAKIIIRYVCLHLHPLKKATTTTTTTIKLSLPNFQICVYKAEANEKCKSMCCALQDIPTKMMKGEMYNICT